MKPACRTIGRERQRLEDIAPNNPISEERWISVALPPPISPLMFVMFLRGQEKRRHSAGQLSGHARILVRAKSSRPSAPADGGCDVGKDRLDDVRVVVHAELIGDGKE